MHALILADIEGVLGVWDFENDKENSKILYTREIEVYIKSLINNGVVKITVCDSHNKGDMILPSIISNKVSLISQAKNISINEVKYDFAIMVGYHGMGESLGIMPHTMRFDFKRIYAGGIPIGEVEIYSRWLGFHGVPVILVTGDREAVYEANCFNPYRTTCCVKSLFQNEHIRPQLIYDKLASSVDAAMGLNMSKCLARDNEEISVEFYNADMATVLTSDGFVVSENKLIFKSCTDFVNNLSYLVAKMNDTNLKIVQANRLFIKKVRDLIKRIKKEDLIKSGIMPFLSKNMYFLDSASRKEILDTISICEAGAKETTEIA